MNPPIYWHNQSIADMEALTESNIKKGLTEKEVRKRLKNSGETESVNVNYPLGLRYFFISLLVRWSSFC